MKSARLISCFAASMSLVACGGAAKRKAGAEEPACITEGRPNFDASFTTVYDAFHGLVDLVGHH